MRGANPHFECSETLLPVDALTLQTRGTPTDYMTLQKLEKQIIESYWINLLFQLLKVERRI